MDELMKAALSQNLGYGLFVFLFFYTLKTNSDREKKYQNTIEILSDKIGVVDEIKKDVIETKKDVSDTKKDIEDIKTKILH